MFRRALSGALILLLFFFVLQACKNPDNNPHVQQPPPSGGVVGSGEDHSGDQSGQTGAFNFSPFKPQINSNTTEVNNVYTGLVDVAISHWPEHGEVVLIMDSKGVHIFNSFGQEILFNGSDTGASVGDYPPFTEGYSILHSNGTTTVWTMDNRFIIENPFNFVLCDNVSSFDFWNFETLGTGNDPLITQIGGPVFDPASGGAGPLGFEWDIFGNLWVRSTSSSKDPGNNCQATTPCPNNGGQCPTLTVYIRGAPGPNCNNPSRPSNGFCSVISEASPWGLAGAILDRSNVDFALTCSPDFDFSATNIMVLSDFCNNDAVWTNPIPDWLQYVGQTILPPPIKLLFQRGNIGANTGTVNDHMHFPWGVMIDRKNDNHVFIADTLNNRIQEYDINGNFLTSYISGDQSLSRGSTNRQFAGPVSMRMDSFNRMFVVDRGTDSGGNAVQDLYFIFRKNPISTLPGDVQGQVIDSTTNQPVLGALVVLQNLTGNVSITTDSNGRFDFTGIIPGHRSLIVSKDAYFPSTQEFDVGPGQTVTLTVQITPRTGGPNGEVTGRVVNAQTGVPIDGALVVVRDTGQRDITGGGSISGGGRFSITNIPPGIHALDFSAVGFESTSRVVTIIAGVDTEIGDVDLKPNTSP